LNWRLHMPRPCGETGSNRLCDRASSSSSSTVENKDPVVHNPHAFEVMGSGRRTLWNIGLPDQGSKLEKEVRVRRGNVIKLECDQHDFMHSWTRVVESP